jgi:hypothetical protein
MMKLCKVCGGDSLELNHLESPQHKAAILAIKLEIRGFRLTDYRSSPQMVIKSIEDLPLLVEGITYVSAETGFFEGELFEDRWGKGLII